MIVLENGDTLSGDATAASVIDYLIHGVVSDALSQLANGQLPISITALYTSAGIVAVSSISMVNTDSVSRTVNLYVKPSGEPARNIIPKGLVLLAGYSLLFDGRRLSVFNTYGSLITSVETPTHTGEVIGDIDLIVSDDVIDTDNLAVRYKSRVTLAGTNVDWHVAQVNPKTLAANTTLTFSNLYVGVKDLEITGDYTLILPSWVDIVYGVYDGTVDNFIQVVCTNAGSGTEKGWASINKAIT